MSPSAVALAGYAAWSLLLLGALAVLRVSLTLSGRGANSFRPTGTDVGAFGARLTRAHANCYESLPIFASLILVALVTGNAGVTDPLALWALAARVGQSTTHLLSTSNPAVQVRFAFFVVQFVIQALWAVQLLGALT